MGDVIQLFDRRPAATQQTGPADTIRRISELSTSVWDEIAKPVPPRPTRPSAARDASWPGTSAADIEVDRSSLQGPRGRCQTCAHLQTSPAGDGRQLVSTVLEDPAVTIRRLRQRLYVIEPVYRAAIALHRNGAAKTFDATERVERAVDRALDTERLLAEGWALATSDAVLMKAVP